MKKVNDTLPFLVSKCGKVVVNSNTGYIYKLHNDKDGYKYISTRINNKPRTFRVHRLVAEAYLCNPNNYPQVNHKNGIKDYNNVSNLEWCNNSMNQRHALKTGLRKIRYGEECSSSKLSEETAKKVFQLIESGYRNKDISVMTGATRSQIKDIRTGKSWKNLAKNYKLKFIRRGRLSPETVQWVCKKLQDGFSVKDILTQSSSKSLTESMIYHIKAKKAYKDISCNYNF